MCRKIFWRVHDLIDYYLLEVNFGVDATISEKYLNYFELYQIFVLTAFPGQIIVNISV